jgi:hypothetical protein
MKRNQKYSAKELEYTFDEFAQHFEAQLIVRDYQFVTREDGEVEIGDDRSFEMNVIRTWDYFKQIYPNDIAMEKGSLFMVMLSHIGKNMDRYDTGTLAVRGSELSMVSERFLRAVHYYFTTRPLSDIKDDESAVKAIVELADSRFKNYL